MLISFSVTNFRSFGEEVTLTMVASNKLVDHENHCVPIGDTGKSVLRASVIYGANAAGKSNLVRAIAFAQQLIREPGDRRYTMPFRFSDNNENNPSSFEFRFLVDGRVFIYGFDIVGCTVLSEWLSVLKGDADIQLYERDKSGAVQVFPAVLEQFPDDATTYETLKVLRQIPVRTEQLFLSRASSTPESAQGKVLKSIIKWFSSTLLVLPANSRSPGILDRLHADPVFRDFCSGFLRSIGTGIGSLELIFREREPQPWEKSFLERYPKQRRMMPAFFEIDTDIIPNPENPGLIIERKLLSEHRIGPGSYSLPFSEESDGTQAILHLMPILASPPDDPLVVVMDELDRSLHPLICWSFIKFFSESCSGAHRQLIVTTHEAHLLNQELLRRDEYWFAEKDSKQQTQLVSLDKFKIRNDLKVERGYLQGRFGAIPMIGGVQELERLLSCEEAPDAEKV
ncbi:MAG TPA: AAA family ATPase [Pirellulales bacterium]|nr:AAA family ATPase [Pirellulales bacterium]